MPKPTTSTASNRVGLRLLEGVGLLALCGATATQAALTVEPISAYNLVVDSNVTSPSTYGPSAATLGAEICADANHSDVFVYIGDGTTPGTYPTTSDTDGNGTYSFTHEGGSAGTADATRYIGDLASGECIIQYWLASYPRCLNLSGGVATNLHAPTASLAASSLTMITRSIN